MSFLTILFTAMCLFGAYALIETAKNTVWFIKKVKARGDVKAIWGVKPVMIWFIILAGLIAFNAADSFKKAAAKETWLNMIETEGAASFAEFVETKRGIEIIDPEAFTAPLIKQYAADVPVHCAAGALQAEMALVLLLFCQTTFRVVVPEGLMSHGRTSGAIPLCARLESGEIRIFMRKSTGREYKVKFLPATDENIEKFGCFLEKDDNKDPADPAINEAPAAKE